MTASCRLGFPALIAANRFYKVSAMPGQSTTLLQKLFAERAIIPLVIAWYCVAYLMQSPLIFTDSFGEDQAGFCGARKFTSVLLLASYEVSVIVVFAGGMALTGVYYFRLAKWLRQNQSISNQESVSYTRSLMIVMKVETLLPLIAEMPTAILTAGQMVLPELPMWLTRVLVGPYWFASCVNPWLTIFMSSGGVEGEINY
uniref:Uncharacterized protein n=1 Tax=Plectus sambesii TaxID=2011161 RepID=A0A914WFS7_9BILA